jgi:hypothetical protein
MPTTIHDVPCLNPVLALTPDRAKRALYVDFEGEGKRSNGEIPQPTMLGIYCREGRPTYRVQTLQPLVYAGFPPSCSVIRRTVSLAISSVE